MNSQLTELATASTDEVESTETDMALSTSTELASETLHEGAFHVPTAIADEPIWIVYRIEENDNGDTKKIPKAPLFHYSGTSLFNVSPTKTEHATTFAEALSFVHESKEELGEDGADGVGLVLDDETDVVGFDFDKCYNHKTGEIEQWALDIVRELDSYTEVSPSGGGLHTLVFGELDDDFQNRNELGLECYEDERYFTFTGRHVEGTPWAIQERTDVGLEVQREMMDERTTVENDSSSETYVDVSEQETREFGSTMEKIVDVASSADDEFESLYRGRIPARFGDDHSKADYYLACKLAFWCNGDVTMMDSIFRQSGLMREKWDAKRGRTTYGRQTLQKACRDNTARCGRDW